MKKLFTAIQKNDFGLTYKERYKDEAIINFI